MLNLLVLIPTILTAAILGDTVGNWFGAKVGPRLSNRESSLLSSRESLPQAKAFYDRHGGKTVTLARLMAFVRNFAPTVSGAARMEHARFFMLNILGGAVWEIDFRLLDHHLGSAFGSIEGIDRYFTLLVLAFYVPGLPAVIHVWRDDLEKILGWIKERLSPEPSPDA